MENKKRTDVEECIIKYKDIFYLKTKVGYKKIILTTDDQLIKDGVQEINDEFLGCFVKNPNCEEVEVEKYFHEVGDTYDYEIIIPKEEPKKETLEEAGKNYIENVMKFSFNSLETKTQANRMLKCVEFGAKWKQKQDENLYSEEEVHDIIESYQNNVENNPKHITYDKWFNQFKKK